jgi:hypothetical protein
MVLRSAPQIKKAIKANLIKSGQVANYQDGKHYIIAIPPNETESFTWNDSAIEVYIASAFDTNLEIDIFGNKKTAFLKANEVYVLNEKNGLMKENCECRLPNIALPKTIEITADQNITVHVINSKNTTSDGYMAIPVEWWGNEYLHCSYYDNYEGGVNTFSGGFLVLGSQDSTNVEVELRGIADDTTATLRDDTSKKIGDVLTFKVDRAEVYQIDSDGMTRGKIDLSGSKITSDKPVGVISYHQRTVIPILQKGTRDHLSSMMQPTPALSTNYASISLARGGTNTNYTATWYDFYTKQVIDTKSGLISKAGEFVDISDALIGDPSISSITGTSVFEADKPILLMQYSYSGAWDGTEYDPFMWNVTGMDQYTNNAIVQAPYNKTFGENYINIIANEISGDPTLPGIKSIEIDNTKLTDLVPSFTTNNIPGTTLYWARIPIASGVHRIYSNGEALFGAYVYGFKTADSYGWPAVMASHETSTTDSLAPSISYVQNSIPFLWQVLIEDNRQMDRVGSEKQQLDSKIAYGPITLIKYIVDLEVENPYEYAKAYFYVADIAGNVAFDSLEYHPFKLNMNNVEEVDFGGVLIEQRKTKTFTFENKSTFDCEISSISLFKGELFNIISDNIPSYLNVGESLEIEIEYAPTEISDKDTDSIIVTAANLSFAWEIKGYGIDNKERIELSSNEIDFGTIYVNDEKSQTLSINNTGQEILKINSIELANGSIFELLNSKPFPMTLGAGKSLYFELVYKPTVASDLDIDTVVVKTDTNTYKCVLRASAEPDLGVYDNEKVDDIIKLSPNPISTDANITITMPEAGNVRVSLYTSTGKLVKELYNSFAGIGDFSFRFNSEGITAGSYSLIIEQADMKYVKQIVISK